MRNTRLSVTGASELTRSASSDAGRFERSPNVEYAGNAVICAAAASAMSRRPEPDVAEPETRRGIEVSAASPRRRRARRRRARAHELAVRGHRRHVGERMPEVRHAGEATSGAPRPGMWPRNVAETGAGSVRVVREVRTQPSLRLADALAPAARVVLELVLAEPADVEVPRRGVREVEAGHRRRGVIANESVRSMPWSRAPEQVEQHALLAVVGTGGVAERRAGCRGTAPRRDPRSATMRPGSAQRDPRLLGGATLRTPRPGGRRAPSTMIAR